MSWVFDELEYVVFSGGGVRGLAFLGVWRVLEQAFAKRPRPLYDQLQGFAGTSAGAFIALMASVGCSEAQMQEECSVLDGMDILRHVDLLNVSEQWGFHDKRTVADRIRQILLKYAGHADITFRDLFLHTHKTFVTTATRVNDGTEVYYSHTSTPDLEVWRAVTASMSIPVLFTPSRIGDEILVDGGMLVNLPLDVFPLHKTLALLLTRTLPFRVASFRDYMMRVLYVAMDGIERARLSQLPRHLQHHVVKIDTKTFSSVEFALKPEQRRALMDLGAESLSLWWSQQFAEQAGRLVLLSSTLKSPRSELPPTPCAESQTS